MKQMATVSGDILEGVSATTLWTLHNRGTEAKRSDGVIHDPWAATLLDAICYDYRKFGRPNQAHPLRALAFDMPRTIISPATGRPRWLRSPRGFRPVSGGSIGWALLTN